MENQELQAMRHTTAHVLAAALTQLYPGVKLGVGPATETGCYYDVLVPNGKKISDTDFEDIEKKMKEIVGRDVPMVREEMGIDEAIALFQKLEQPFKVELLQQLKEKGTTAVLADNELQDVDATKISEVSVYKTGEFVDLCRGPHIATTGNVGAFKLQKLAGAYWRGSDKNPQMQRVYVLAFENEQALKAHQTMLEEAAKRDHRVLGKELDLFVFSDLVGPGLPLWTPRGTFVRHALNDYVWELREQKGYERVTIPHITKKDLYETSGHWGKYADQLFKVSTREGHEFAMKPMNCPHHSQIYAARKRSYRELPQRYSETTMVYRDEQTGELSGLSRVRSITQDDAHVFCRASQVKDEFFKVWDIIDTFYKTFGFELTVRLSLHDPKTPEKYLGTKELWEKAEQAIRDLAKERGVATVDGIGEAAIYGPKIDFMTKDSIGRVWQVATIQLDMNQPERFDLSCVNEEGKDERIVMIHCAIMGSIERFSSVFIEHTAGNFPLWLSPTQVQIASVAQTHVDAAHALATELREAGIRVVIDDGNDTVGGKIKKVAQWKVPYAIVLGDKELAQPNLSIRVRGKKDLWEVSKDEFIKICKEKLAQRTLEL